MLFRPLIIVFVSLLLILSGCAGENQSKKEVLKIKVGNNSSDKDNGKSEVDSEEMKCITELSASFSKYFKGEMRKAELKEFWNCFDTIANIYVENADKITMDGLINVIQLFIDKSTSKIKLKKYKPEFRYLKQALLGNKKNNFSKSEINHFMYLLNKALPEASENLRSELPEIFNLNANEELTLEEVEQSLNTLEESLLTLTSQFKGNYSQKDLKFLARFIDKEFLSKGAFKAEPYIPVLFNIKKLFLGGDSQVISFDDWKSLTKMGVKTYGALYKWKRVKRGKSLSTQQGFDVLDDIVNYYFTLAQEGLSANKNNIWSQKEIESLMNSVEQLELLPQNFTSQDLMEAWGIVSLNIFNDERGNFTKDSLNIMMNHYGQWSKAQKQIISSGSLSKNLKLFISEMKWSLLHNAEDILVFSEDKSSFSKADFANSYSKFNIFHTLANILTESYGENKNEMSWEELSLLFEDFRPLVVKFGVSKSLYKAIPQILFIFGNSFLPNSKADKVFHKHEFMNILSYAISSQGTSKLWKEESGDSCFPRADCMVQFLSTDKAWEAMPLWKKAILGTEVDTMDKNLLVMLSPFSKLGEELSSTNLLIGSLLSQVIESLIIAKDKNKDNLLDTQETISVIDTLWPAVSVALNTDSPELKETLMATSTYILKFNQLPTDSELSRLRFEHWKERTDKWNLSVDRLDLINFVSKIKSIMPQ